MSQLVTEFYSQMATFIFNALSLLGGGCLTHTHTPHHTTTHKTHAQHNTHTHTHTHTHHNYVKDKVQQTRDSVNGSWDFSYNNLNAHTHVHTCRNFYACVCVCFVRLVNSFALDCSTSSEPVDEDCIIVIKTVHQIRSKTTFTVYDMSLCWN